MPPRPNDALRLHFLLLVMRAAIFALVERVLYPDVRLHLALRRLEPDKPRDLERVSDLDLRARIRRGTNGGDPAAAQGGGGVEDIRRSHEDDQLR